ncbi:Pkinase-domain-containing protein [Piptocephalis cylindrospora]|uniref:Pkinase-domain-containing protein n=1 Tax=Piptocephalis cylindrospora TaxID=1907219 RepID=A0A4P9Y5J6_9FUNG|nr:Pkinase-domain-containing protein [Piptocephalis cylindrospora]|eukprot:RKP14223.1 Pkinase-domain-containing protein [Piptocephalis cylindrospora]
MQAIERDGPIVTTTTSSSPKEKAGSSEKGKETTQISKSEGQPIASQPSAAASESPLTEQEAEDKTEDYVKDRKIGEGAYAVVYEATRVSTGERVAIKKIKAQKHHNGIDVSTVREIKALQELKHPNVLRLIEIYTTGAALNLVLEYLEADLEVLIKDRSLVFSPADVKSWLGMALRGLEHCHRNWVLHRDIKPNNLLLGSDGQLKLADFGLARFWGDYSQSMTPQVITRWYRPPELLMGAKTYSSGVDLWALGCVFAELMLRAPYLPGDSEMDQLDVIFRALGTPTDEEWPGMRNLPDYLSRKPLPRPLLRGTFQAASPAALDVLSSMLRFDPNKRISARDALHHDYFKEYPRPTPPARLPKQTKSGVKAASISEMKRKWDADAQAQGVNGKKVARVLFPE